MSDEKDRLGNKLRDVEKGREDQYFAQRDRALLEKLKSEQTGKEEEQQLKELARMRCPKCGARLATTKYIEVSVDECPAGHGMWLDKGEIDEIVRREKTGWFARYVLRGT